MMKTIVENETGSLIVFFIFALGLLTSDLHAVFQLGVAWAVGVAMASTRSGCLTTCAG